MALNQETGKQFCRHPNLIERISACLYENSFKVTAGVAIAGNKTRKHLIVNVISIAVIY